MRFGKYLAAAMVCAALVGCGGGSSAPLPDEPSASAGVWSGATTDGRQLLAFLLSDGSYWLIYGEQDDNDHTAGAATGTATFAAWPTWTPSRTCCTARPSMPAAPSRSSRLRSNRRQA
jgi:hypothetical protein